MKRLEKANKFINENMHLTNNKPRYHFSPPFGWLNDPNGFCYYNNKYHLFYQAYPYDTLWNDMHWGYSTSEDLVNFKYEKMVMANDTLADANGVFSGSAIEKDSKLYFMYTGHIDPNLNYSRVDKEVVQYQNIAVYNEDATITKYENNPVIGCDNLPEGYKIYDFRDPKVYKKEEIYYSILSVRNKDDRGSLILYKSLDLIHWEFLSEIYTSNPKENILYECPDLFTIGDKDVLVFSIMPAKEKYEKEVKHCVKYAIGKMNYEKGIFEEEFVDFLDYGYSFYAPQSTVDKDGNRVIIGWLCERSKNTLNYLKEYKYNGIMSLVRELSIKDGKLISKANKDIKNFFSNKITYNDLSISGLVSLKNIDSISSYIKIDLENINKMLTISLFDNSEKSFDFNITKNSIHFKSLYSAKNENKVEVKNIKTLEFFIDTHVIELFINDGEKVISELCYDNNKKGNITLKGDNELVKSIVKYDI